VKVERREVQRQESGLLPMPMMIGLVVLFVIAVLAVVKVLF
jgi:hypothetical protein